MFDRCDVETMRVVESAIAAARELGHHHIGTEHLLLAFAEHPEVLPPPVSLSLPEPDTIRSGITSIIGDPPRRDSDVLRSVGIDLDEVRAAVRRTFGDEAIDRLRLRRVHQPWQPWRRPSRRCTSLLAGAMTMAPRVKQALERARHEADRRQRRLIDPALLLLGIVEVEDALANRLLRDNGVDPEAIKAILGGNGPRR